MLEKKNLLHRLYTQNIDALELKVGLELPEPNVPAERCIPLHGLLTYVKCTACHRRQRLETYFEDYRSGIPANCPACLKDAEERQARHSPKRRRQIGQLRPDILLYGESNPWGELVAEVIQKDAKNVTTNAVLLVVGTSLKIPGIQEVIRLIGRAVKAKKGHVININITPNQSGVRRHFDLEVLGDCQTFADKVIERFQENEKGKGSVTPYEHAAVARADYRPLWDWTY